MGARWRVSAVLSAARLKLKIVMALAAAPWHHPASSIGPFVQDDGVDALPPGQPGGELYQPTATYHKGGVCAVQRPNKAAPFRLRRAQA